MLCLADEWRKSGVRPDVHVLTVDHGLRAGSAAEARQVALLCAERGLRHEILHWQHSGVKSGLQAKARQARYELMTAWCKAQGASHLLTAHTLDDQAETVLMRKQRTSTLASLSGVWKERDWNGIKLVRPLLGHDRAELRSYLNRIGQQWIDDPSNDNPVFERVRIRNFLASQDRGMSLALAETASQSAAQHETNLAKARNWVEKSDVWRTGYAQVERASFLSQSQEQAQYVLHFLIQALGGLPVQPQELSRLAAWLNGEASGRRTLGGCLFAKRSKSFLVGREPGRIRSIAEPIPEAGFVAWDGRFFVHGPAGGRILAAERAGVASGPEEAPAFVRAGWPVVFSPNGSLVETKIEFRPYLR